jgi:hypothetical protein
MAMRTILATRVLGAGLVLVIAASSAVAGQEMQAIDPVTVVEDFLMARDSGDPLGAAIWCADLLELQDMDGQWFIDSPSVSAWLRQLTERFVIDRLSPLVAEGNTVSWTERLTPRRLAYPDALHSSIIIEVHAVIRDGRLAYLSGPYPPIPFRAPAATAPERATSAPGSSTAILGPGVLFVSSALGLMLTVLLAAGSLRLARARLWHRERGRGTDRLAWAGTLAACRRRSWPNEPG